MSTLADQFDDFFLQHHLKAEELKLLLAVSGGVDSSVLNFLCHHKKLNFAIAHCNFKLRGKDSDADEAFTKELADEYGVKFYSTSFPTAEYAEKHHLSIQMAARKLRYDWFEKIRKKGNFHFLLTAHHLQDSLETIMINLGRGTGLAGLKGIGSSSHVLRPLEMASKPDILEFARQNKLNWREDHSNQEDDYLRNFIRHHVLPSYFRAFNTSTKGLRSSIRNLQSDIRFFEHQLKISLERLLIKNNDSESILIPELQSLPGYGSLLHYWLSHYGNFDIKAIERSFEEGSGQQFRSGEYMLIKNRDELVLSKVDNNEISDFFIDENDVRIEEPILLEFGSLPMRNFTLSKDPLIGQFDKEKLQFPLKIRKWQEGDSFQPLGMKGHKKLSDYFIDRKYSFFQKERTWLLCSGEDIIWIAGERIDDRYKINDKTKTVYFARLNEALR